MALLTITYGITAKVYSVTTDNHGDKTRTLVGEIPNCGFEPGNGQTGSSSEDTFQKDQVVTDARLHIGAPHIPITATSEVEVLGRTWQVEGEPQWWRNVFTGWCPGGVVHLRRVTG